MQTMNEYTRLLNRAAKLCSSSEKCTGEIREKLYSWGMDEEKTDKAVDYLVQNHFIDDHRYTQFYISEKLRINHWGRIKIRHMLRRKQIKETIINDFIGQINREEYMEILTKVIQTKIKTVGNLSDQREKAKVIRFAAQRGFTSEEIFEALDKF